MAEKKYIGKPGKQDDPCWKGYEMVGMKKKGGRKVPNCVPEATDIIAKAKAAVAKKAGAKLKLDPDTGTPDHFTAAQRRKKGLDEAGSKQHIEVTHTTGQKSKKPVHPDNAFKALNHYRSLSTTKSARIVSEEDSKEYPRKGFPEEGDYGYHPNPGLKPQESDKDQDMDKAYKKATEKEGRKPLNAKVLEFKEALTRVTSGNKGYGYHGNVEARDDAEKDKRYSAMHRYAKKLVGDAGHLQDAKKPNVMVKHFLDSAHGRHIADNPTDENITSRFAHFKKSYDPAMHEEVEAIDELSKDAMLNYLHANKHKNTKGGNPRRDLVKSMRGTDLAVRKYTAKPGSKYVRVPATEEVELDEAYGMWKVDFPKQHAGKAVAAGSVHVKAQNTAHAHKVAAKRVGVDHKAFKSKVTKSSVLPEDVDSYADALIKRNKGNLNKGHVVNAARIAGMDHKKLMSAVNKKVGRIKEEVELEEASHLPQKTNEELGKDNEWGTDALRKKFAKATPGQESMAADKIPSFDPRYDDVATQYCGGLGEEVLNEISAKGAEARAKFQAKLQKILNDPERIAKAKKTIAKRKAAEKAAEPKHLVMQLRKATSIGSKVEFRDGSSHHVAPNHVEKFNDKYHSLKSSIEKESLINRAHKSHADFMKSIAEEMEHDNCGTPDCCGQCGATGPEYQSHRGNGGFIGTVETNDEDIRFDDVDSDELYSELEKEVDDLDWEDVVDTYDPEELEYESEESEPQEMEEAITPAGRLKKKFNAMRTKTRRNMARNLALKRVSTPDKLKARSIRTARNMVYKRFLRGRDKSTLSSTERARIESQVKRMAPMVARLSVRVMPKLRKLEQTRIQHARGRKKK